MGQFGQPVLELTRRLRSHADLARLLQFPNEKGTLGRVPFSIDWRARKDSNLRPPGS
jgi:hypothetical protein